MSHITRFAVLNSRAFPIINLFYTIPNDIVIVDFAKCQKLKMRCTYFILLNNFLHDRGKI